MILTWFNSEFEFRTNYSGYTIYSQDTFTTDLIQGNSFLFIFVLGTLLQASQEVCSLD
jgi:hypothetical protein